MTSNKSNYSSPQFPPSSNNNCSPSHALLSAFLTLHTIKSKRREAPPLLTGSKLWLTRHLNQKALWTQTTKNLFSQLPSSATKELNPQLWIIPLLTHFSATLQLLSYLYRKLISSSTLAQAQHWFLDLNISSYTNWRTQTWDMKSSTKICWETSESSMFSTLTRPPNILKRSAGKSLAFMFTA